MTASRTENTIRLTIGLLAALAFVSLVACSKKPPGCADNETVSTIRQITVDNAKQLLAGAQQFQDDPNKIQDGYFQALKSEVVNVVSDGYNEQAKKISCRGKLTLHTAAGGQFSRDIVYSTQRTEDKDGGFLVEVQAFQPFVAAVAEDIATYYTSRRYRGEWKGEYQCNGIDEAADGPKGPFKMPVSLVVDEQSNAKLERSTKGGGSETLEGRVSQTVRLRGRGSNSPDDVWTVSFQGAVKGADLAAQGEITADGRTLRQCWLKLKLG